MRLPYDVTAKHIRDALKYIDENGVPPRRKARGYWLRANERQYPPKYVICVAHIFVDGKEWPNIFGGGPEANNFLISKGFQIYDRKGRCVGVHSVPEREESEFPEGRALFRKHVTRERDTKLAKRAKEKRLAEVGELRCDVCKFCFSDSYGSVGVGYIEAHHTVPVSELGAKRPTRIEELAMVCSNCHRMLHRRRPWLTLDSLRQVSREAN